MNDSSFLIIGHRGAAGCAPENTLLALERGIRQGARAVEFDVQLHPSGELFLLHDLTLDRTTNGKGLAERLPWDKLRALDAGGGQQIPTLGEALELVERQVLVNVELKTWNGTGAAVAQVLREHIADGWSPADFLVSSFHLPELFEFKQAAPEIPIGVLTCGVPLDWAAVTTELGAQALNISAEFVDAQLVDDAHKRGVKVYVYTVNRAEDVALLQRLGVDGVFTDFPERFF
ncbi:MAG TPA: glycerophosphodiester phosphodiesterase family protein [Nevskiaceae bacterium]|nr:glycerophosphodiester phosphodiesterase family protein [Nevskiaceae bacterium]